MKKENQKEIQRQVDEKQIKEEKMFNSYISEKNKQENIIKFHKYTPTSSPYDVSIISGKTTTAIAEIKIRDDKNISLFLRYGAYLEQKKVMGMENKINEINASYGAKYDVKKLYYIFCKDGILVYQLKNPNEYNYFWKLLPKNNTNLEQKEEKLVTTLFDPLEIIYYL